MTIPEGILKKLNKDYGGTLISASKFKQGEKKIIPWSPALDAAAGGIQEGTWTIVSGAPKCGKTTSILDFCKSAQQHGKYVVYDAPEARLKNRDLIGIDDLDQENLLLVMSNEDQILTAEQHLTICRDILKNTKGIVLVIDSASALCAEGEMTADITAQARNAGPKLLATFCRQMASVVAVRNHIVIIIQHIIANTSGKGAPTMEDGGNKIQYQTDYKIRCRGIKRWNIGDKEDETSTQIGQIVEWQVLTSAVKPPGQKVESYIRYGHGIDKEMEVITFGSDLGIITQAGAWFSMTDLEGDFAHLNGQKFQGKENFRTMLMETPGLTDYIAAKIRELT